MKILIVEDETAALDNLVEIISKIDATIQIAGTTESIRQTVKWLELNQNPDLILMDIHLSDGSAFTIFDKLKPRLFSLPLTTNMPSKLLG
jgi:response regulator of citrate/malate metabolism